MRKRKIIFFILEKIEKTFIFFMKLFEKEEKEEEKPIFGEENQFLGIEAGLPINYLHDMYFPYETELVVATTEGEIIIEND